MSLNSLLHHHIIDQIIKQGFAPDIPQLAGLCGLPEAEVREGLIALQEYHGVVLHPNQSRIWVAHPFSLAPTNFTVKAGARLWWGNCAWCSLGVAALIGEDCEIDSTLGAHGEKVTLHVRNGEVLEGELLIHFPIPMEKAWDNVIYTCSTMQLFRDEAQVDDWCRRHNIPRGDVQKVGSFWEFTQEWYGKHRDEDWKKWSVSEAVNMFRKFGLEHEVWHLPVGEGRF